MQAKEGLVVTWIRSKLMVGIMAVVLMATGVMVLSGPAVYAVGEVSLPDPGDPGGF
jgi:hypothetical protein